MAEGKQFEEALCGCTKDVKSFLIGCLVPYGANCLQGMAIQEASGQKESCLVPCLLSSFLACFGAGINRQSIRKIYKLEGSYCGDCCIHLWCHACASCQEYREVQWQKSI